MAAILKKGAILDFQMATKLREIIPIVFKTYKGAPRSFKSDEFIILYDQSRLLDAEWRAVIKSRNLWPNPFLPWFYMIVT